jgi:UDP-glucose 4-epimerase
MSRGSVIPLFLDQIHRGEPISITNPAMTRFMMSLEDSVSLVKYAFTNASNGDLFVRKAPACSVETLITAVIELIGVKGKVEIKEIGTRHGEKLYESLLGSEEGSRAIDRGDYYQVPLDTRSLDYQIYFNKGQSDVSEAAAYTSHNTKQLDVDQVIDLINQLPEFIEYKAKNL